MGGGWWWINQLQPLPQGLVLTFDFDFDFDFDPDPDPELDNSTYTQYGYMYSSQVGELRLVIKADKTITVESRWMASWGTASSPTNRMSSLSKLSLSIQGEC